MKKNVGTTDRNIRLAVAGVLILAALVGGAWSTMSTAAAVVLTVIGLVVLITGFTGVCLAYIPLGIDTTRQDGQA